MSLEDELDWYKEINMYNLTCTVLLSISKEDAEILNTILLICDHYKELSASFLYDNFGLNNSIANRLLRILAEDLKIFEKEEREDCLYFRFKEGFSKERDLFREKTLYFPSIVRYSLCLHPLIISNKLFYIEDIQDSKNNELIFNTLEKIEGIINSGNDIKKIYNIPYNYCGLNLSEGVQINGINRCILKWKNDKFFLFKNKFEICRISDKHPDYKELKKEFEKLKSNISKLKGIIREEIINLLNIEKFNINFTENGKELSVNINENNINKIGKIYQIFNSNDGKTLSFPLGIGWFYKTKLKFTFSDPIMNFWIKIIMKLNELIKKDYLSLLNKNYATYVSKIEKIINDVENERHNIEFDTSIDFFQGIIQNVCDLSKNGWFHLIYAKLSEKEVFE